MSGYQILTGHPAQVQVDCDGGEASERVRCLPCDPGRAHTRRRIVTSLVRRLDECEETDVWPCEVEQEEDLILPRLRDE